MDTKGTIIELYKNGFSRKDIAKTMYITERYVRKVIATRGKKLPSELTERNYIAAIKHGFESKEEFAVHFGVSRMTLQRFEERTGIKQKIARYLHIQGKTASEITAILNTKTSRLKIYEAETLPTIAGIKSDLETILGVLREYAQIDDEAQTQYYALKRICEKL